MSDQKTIRVPFEGEGQDRAVLLLAAAEKLGYDANVVATDTSGPGFAFHAPEDVVKEAFGAKHGLSEVDGYEHTAVEQSTDYADLTIEAEVAATPEAPEQPPNVAGEKAEEETPAKKAPAKKSAAKKAAKRPAKKAAAKKTAAKKSSKET